MNASMQHFFPEVDPALIAVLPVLDQFHEGVIVTDALGRILYINALQEKIDELTLLDIKGKSVADAYQVDEGASPALKCILTGKRINNLACFYRTRTGKMVNSIHNVIPLYADKKLIGTICFIRAYHPLESEFESLSIPENIKYIRQTDRLHSEKEKKKLKNGTRFTFQDIIGQTPDFLAILESCRLASDSPSPVMIYGETGTGKELVAQSIHNESRRRARNYVAINCAAIPENLLEGILFGTAKGAFTGAADKPGLFEKASKGTLFLDEINSMSMGLQAKLLRVLQERKVRRVGALDEIPLDLKIISSVNEDPHEAIKNGNFRTDLLYRLGVVFIRIPPLRERKEDLMALVSHFIEKFNLSMDKKVQAVSPRVMDLFYRYEWEGNIRELEHVIEGAMNLVKTDTTICSRHLSVQIGNLFSTSHPISSSPSSSFDPLGESEKADIDVSTSLSVTSNSNSNLKFVSASPATLNREGQNHSILPDCPSQTGLEERRRQHEIEVIEQALTHTKGNVAKAARQLKLSPQLLHYKLKKYQIKAAAFKPLIGIS